jgi:signal transduction histidine kinase
MIFKLFRSYKEIWFGFALGLLAWLVDAVMHVELGAGVHSEGLFAEVFHPHPTALVFRMFYLVVTGAFGVFLWRANWRDRELRELERSIIAFQRHLDAPALRLVSMASQLRGRNSVRLDEAADGLATAIAGDAELIDDLAKRYLEFSRLVQEGKTAEAVETLQSIESWLANRKAITKH